MSGKLASAVLGPLLAIGLLGPAAESSPLRATGSSDREERRAWVISAEEAPRDHSPSPTAGFPIPTLPSIEWPDIEAHGAAPIDSRPTLPPPALGLDHPADGRPDPMPSPSELSTYGSRPPLLLAPSASVLLTHAESMVTGQADASTVEPGARSAASPDHRIPEPGSYLILLTGLIGLAVRRHLRRRLSLPDPTQGLAPATRD